ncbi:hypothetical protein DPMN_049199 [Dreissena polymorpha]|uniref:Uncharacterized protein n=1 Tax=Dreissena polymorpha TaxID=45954 RepID=A0A9D4DAY1_DREPO|nr:hypothetical protein DPMN_049199 [Dreissena polymorpha]
MVISTVTLCSARHPPERETTYELTSKSGCSVPLELSGRTDNLNNQSRFNVTEVAFLIVTETVTAFPVLLFLQFTFVK